MTHVRKQIRDAAATAVTGLSTTGARVYKCRNLPLTVADLPSLAVYTRDEAPDYEKASMADSSGRVLVVRVVELHVVGHTMDSDGPAVEDQLDAISAQVETAIFAAFPFAGAQRMTLGSQTTTVDPSGAESVGAIDMVFNVEYRTAEGAPETAV